MNDKDRILEDYKSLETKFNIMASENKELTEFVSKKKMESVKKEEETIKETDSSKKEMVKKFTQKIISLQNANSKLKKAVNVLNKKLLDTVTKNMLKVANQNNLTRSHNVTNRTSKLFSNQLLDITVNRNKPVPYTMGGYTDADYFNEGPIYENYENKINNRAPASGNNEFQNYDSNGFRTTGFESSNLPNIRETAGEYRQSSSDYQLDLPCSSNGFYSSKGFSEMGNQGLDSNGFSFKREDP